MGRVSNPMAWATLGLRERGVPKIRELERRVKASPAQIEARLSAQLRYRAFPHTTSILGKGGLAGHASAKGFVVAADERRMMQSVQAVATGEVEDLGDGSSRVRVRVGMPRWVTWLLRASVGMVPVYMGMLAFKLLQEGTPMAAILVLGAMLLTTVGSVGWVVYKADDSVDALVPRIEATLAALEAPPQQSPQMAQRPQAEARPVRPQVKGKKDAK